VTPRKRPRSEDSRPSTNRVVGGRPSAVTIDCAPVGPWLGLAPMDVRLQVHRSLSRGRAQAERGADTGDGAELVEATAKSAIAVTAPCSDP
jgi:hypothetical protein